jgi:hypothetical protein
MYARFCRARYGVNARQVAEENAAELRRSGDAEGARVWTEVKRQIELQGSHEAAA